MIWPIDTYPGWRWWYAFRKATFGFETKGCHHNEHERDEDCPDVMQAQELKKQFENGGWKKIAFVSNGFIWQSPVGRLIRQIHHFGR